MKLEIISVSGESKFEVEVKRKVGGINDYLISDKIYRAFQYDCSDRPENYEKEHAQTKKFHGWLIGRGKNPTIECYVKIKY